MTLKNSIHKILLNMPETRSSDKKLIWQVWKAKGILNLGNWIDQNSFMEAPSFESIRRCRQSLQRSDLLSGRKLIQPTIEVKKSRDKLAREKGFSFMEGRPVWNPEKQVYEM